MTTGSSPVFDAAVIGAGPAGTTAARQLAGAGLRTLLVGCGPAEHIGETLPPAATPLLQRLGLWASFQSTAPLPCYGNRSAWGGDGHLSAYDFIRDPHGPGWHIDRPRFDAMLCAAAQQAGADRLDGARLRAVERRECSWGLSLHGGRDVTAAFVIDASGRAAAFARRIGVRRLQADALVAAVAFLRPRQTPAADSTTLVEAMPDGWWYSAVLPSGDLAAAFITAPEQLTNGRLGTPAGWLAGLEASEHTRLRVRQHGYRLVRAPRVAAASCSRLERAAGDGWIAAGDAAAAHDPLSSDGIGSALTGGARAARVVLQHFSGDRGALAAYSDQVARSFSRYLSLRCAYYAEEDRWPDAPFWRVRGDRLRHVTPRG